MIFSSESEFGLKQVLGNFFAGTDFSEVFVSIGGLLLVLQAPTNSANINIVDNRLFFNIVGIIAKLKFNRLKKIIYMDKIDIRLKLSKRYGFNVAKS